MNAQKQTLATVSLATFSIFVSIVSGVYFTTEACAAEDAPVGLPEAIALYEHKRFYTAMDELEVLVASNPPSGQAWLFLGHCYLQTGRTEKAVDAYGRYIELAPDAEGIDKYKTLIGVLRLQLKTTSPGAGGSAIAGDTMGKLPSDNYFKFTTVSGLHRWPDSRIPISVYIESGKEVGGFRPEFVDVLRQALREWTEETGRRISFTFVKDIDKASMRVIWTCDLHAPELKAEAGKAEVQSDIDGIKEALVRLLTVSPFHEAPLGTGMLHSVCLHEIGHALGLLGHSPYQDDIMYPQLLAQGKISARDRNTLLELYQAFCQAEIKEKENLSASARANLLLAKGTRACFDKKWQEAIESLLKVVKLEPTNILARSNLAVAANNIAVEKFDEASVAMVYLHQSLYFQPLDNQADTNLRS
ncbi:MAG: tetratricopeptide repeat protein, partial [Candidatus Obscuribacterales bacterium]|nr:tetratricopeptide repeat protein [Candidatus Obscuribacterales bacterium]